MSHLQVHTEHSHLFGASRTEEIVEAAKAGGVRALAITDLGGIFDPYSFQEACEREGIRPILGARLGCRTLLVQNEEGYRNLCFLVSAHHLRPGANFDALLRERGDGVAVVPPGAAVVPVAFHAPERRGLHRLLRAIAKGALVKTTPAEGEPLLTAAQMRRRFPKAALATTNALADACDFRLPPRRPPIFPQPLLPDGDTAASRLFHLATEGVKRRYRPIPPEGMRRLLHEIGVIHELHFDAYFVIVHGIVEFANARGIAMVGRGSAANSLVAYALGITNVDPLRYELLFERFLNRARMHDPPDIDLDLDWRRRDEVLEHVYDAYGHERVAMICTFQTMQFRAAFREAAKCFGIPPPEVDRLSKLLPHSPSGPLDAYPELRRFPTGEGVFPAVLRAARALCDFPRHLSIHAGGIVIADRPLTDYLPVQRSHKGLVVTQFDMHGVERTGLVKIDLLGHRSLAVVADATRDAGVDPVAIPEEDPAAGALLRAGGTIGVFQLESPGMRNLLQSMGGTTQDDAMIGLSLIRPGPAGSGMKDAYVRRRRGEETCDSQRLARLLPATHGVMLYQEDILRLARDVAGLTLERADELRRALAKKTNDDAMRTMAAEFRDGARARGVPDGESAHLWALTMNFVAYAYSKAHAATYGRIAYQALWLKAHHPAAFFAAVLANGGGFYEGRAYLEEARRLGVRILLPDINKSAESEIGEGGGEGGLRIGLRRVRDLHETTLRVILERRPFLSLTDFLRRVPEARQRESEHLVLTGCFDAFDGTRPEKLWRVLLHRKAAPAPLPGLFTVVPAERALPAIRDYTPDRMVLLEMELLGLSPTAHPMALFARAARDRNAVRAADLPAHAGRRVALAGWMTTYRRIRTKRGELMKFVTLEDESGVAEVTFFPDAYRRCGHLLVGYGPYLVRGRVDDHMGALTLAAEEAEILEADGG